jgi:hypothetical protein
MYFALLVMTISNEELLLRSLYGNMSCVTGELGLLIELAALVCVCVWKLSHYFLGYFHHGTLSRLETFCRTNNIFIY